MRSYSDLITCKMTDARLADAAIVADGFVTAIGQRNFDGFTIGIQEDIDILPFVTTCIVFQAEGNKSPLPSSPLGEAFCLTGLPPKGG